MNLKIVEGLPFEKAPHRMSDEELKHKASKLFPDVPTMQEKWLAAIRWLRAGRGWCADLVPGKEFKRCGNN